MEKAKAKAVAQVAVQEARVQKLLADQRIALERLDRAQRALIATQGGASSSQAPAHGAVPAHYMGEFMEPVGEADEIQWGSQPGG